MNCLCTNYMLMNRPKAQATISIPIKILDAHREHLKSNVARENNNIEFIFQESQCDSPTLLSISDKSYRLGTVNVSHNVAMTAKWTRIQGALTHYFRNFS